MIETELSTRGPEIRLQLGHFEDGWGWHGWEICVGGSWRALPPPARENQRRRFRTKQTAEQFFHLLAEFIEETATEYISARRAVPRRI